MLCVEDNPGDVQLIQEALRNCTPPIEVHEVSDGVQALAFLRRQPPYESAPTPDLVLLDLGLPKKDGLETLVECKQDPRLKRIPITVFTSDPSNVACDKVYDLGANCCVVKPSNLEEMLRAIRELHYFWFCISVLPTRASAAWHHC
jgi:CheY-like chemotaxis protein